MKTFQYMNYLYLEKKNSCHIYLTQVKSVFQAQWLVINQIIST